jgi:hypothetical protein
MYKLVVSLVLFAAIAAPAETKPQDAHLREDGSNAIFARSAFAHGYRHGYEEGYHVGNIDINMGRQPRTSDSQFHGLSHGYSPDFGPRKSFDAGFQKGVKAGYSDGFAGHNFRAVETFRRVADSLSEAPQPADPRYIYFDQGFSSGYEQGLANVQKQQGEARPADFRFVPCSDFHPASQQDLPAEGSFCEGFRRGYIVGRGDALAHYPERGPLEASK